MRGVSIPRSGAKLTSCLERVVLVAVVAAAFALSASDVAAQDAGTRAKIERLIREGTDLFDLGRYDEASARLRQALSLDPKAEEAHRLVREIGDKVLAQMMTEPRIGREATVIYDLYRLHASRLKRDRKYIGDLVAITIDAQAHPLKQWEAIHKLQQVGQFAIPFLIEALGNERDHEIRGLARICATKMGTQAVLPVIELLRMKPAEGEEGSRERLIRENACLILGDFDPPDERALAGLKRIVEDGNESPAVRKYAMRSLQKVTGLDVEELPSAQDYYYRKADRYVREVAGVPAETSESDGVVWRLENGKLVDYQAPRYAWNELMAEQACYECIAIDPDYRQIYPMLAQVLATQIAEARELLDIAIERPSGRPFSEEEIVEVRTRDARLFGPGLFLDALGAGLISEPELSVPRTPIRRNLLLGSMGPVYIYQAIDKCLRDATDDGRALPKLAVTVLSDVAYALDSDGDLLPSGRGGAPSRKRKGEEEPEDAGVALINALRYEAEHSEQVHYWAAIALARMCPPKMFTGSEDVVSTLARAIGESGPLQVLLVEEDASIRNEMAAKLREIGIGVSYANSAREGYAKATSFPPYDMILVSPKLGADEDAPWLLERLSGDARSRSAPVGILTSYETRDADMDVFKGHAIVKGYVPIQDSGRDLKGLVSRVSAQRGSPIMSKKRAEEIAVAAAEALAGIDPHLAAINGMKVEDCGEACITALENRPDEVRRPCIEALGVFQIGAAHEKLEAIATDPNEALAIRAAAIRSLGQITPELGLDKLLRLAGEEKDYLLRCLASHSYGLSTPDPARLREFLEELRLPMEEKRAIPEQ
jgi:CheY-like chemotaxis protein